MGQSVLAFIAGALFPLSLSPFDAWPLAFLVPAILFLVTLHASRSDVLRRFYLFNVGMFATGISWIFVSVSVYGGVSDLLAGFIVVLFVLAWSLVCLPQAWLYSFLRPSAPAAGAAFAALWVLQEWFRGWFLTGFPWLYLGYGAMDTWVVGFAPALGVFGVSLVVCLVSVFTLLAVSEHRIFLLTVPAFGLLLGVIGMKTESTAESGSVSVSLVQGNIDQHIKWRPEMRQPIVDEYLSATETEWGRDLVIWPEAAITVFEDQAKGFLEELSSKAAQEGTTLLTGIPDRNEQGGFQNTVVALGQGNGQYIKRRLVPFGEYVPLESVLRGLIRFFDLPMSRNEPGPVAQPLLTLGELTLSTSICYEVVYPDLVRKTSNHADLLVTVSNDTWFGESIGPWQHLQMARMRAIENGRTMIRSTNNGVTAIIDHRGDMIAELPQFEAGVLRGRAEVRSGQTPYNQWGSAPVLLLCLIACGWIWWIRSRVRSDA